MMNTSKKLVAAGTWTLLLLTATASAQGPMGQGPGAGRMGGGPGGNGMMPSFADFDTDKDGGISQSEFEQTRAQRIAERSQQGYQMRGLANAPSFTDLDTNGDGSLDKSEFSTGLARHHGGPPPRP